MPRIQDNSVQTAFQSALTDFCSARQRANGCVPHQITHPMLLLTVGSKIRKELLESVLPEFQRHWPDSFAGDLNDGRIVVCSFDREAEELGTDRYFFHHQLTCPLYSNSLAEGESGQEECRKINTLLREAVQQFRVTGTLVSRLRAVALVCADDPDSGLTGDLLSVARQHMSNYLGCDDVNNGIIGAFLSSTGFVSEEHLNHTKSFFQQLPVWHDRMNEGMNPVFAPFIGENAPLVEPFSIRPIVFRTYLLGDMDSHMVSTRNGRRSGILADALEMDAMFHGSSVQLLGTKPTSIDDEYVILSAMDPVRWSSPAQGQWADYGESVMRTLEKSLPSDLSVRLEERLSLICIGRYVENAQFYDSLDELEEEYFGRAFQRAVQEWMEQTLKKTPFPYRVEERIKACQDLDRLDRYRRELQEWLGNSMEPVPERANTVRREMIRDIWALRDELCGKYAACHEICAHRILKNWVLSCLELVERVRNECVDRNHCRERFERMRNDMIQAKRHRWDRLLRSPYLGPAMRPVEEEQAKRYDSLVVNSMRGQGGECFKSLLDLTSERIIRDDSPDNIEGVVFCRTNVVEIATSVEIGEGVSKGRVLTFTDVTDLGDINIPGCLLSGIRP